MSSFGKADTKPVPVAPDVNILSVDVECWHQLIYRNLTGRLIPPSRSAEHMTHFLLELFREKNVRATFFVLGCMAEAFPKLVRLIAEEGHEVATHGLSHVRLKDLGPKQFRDEVTDSMSLLTEITGEPVIGFRAPEFSIMKETLWALDILWECGIRYDSSIYPIAGSRYGIPEFPEGPTRVELKEGSIIEVPPSTLRVFGRNIPLSGGRYFRTAPYGVAKRAVRSVNRQGRPFLLYLHPYEVSSERLSCRGLPRPFNRADCLTTEFKYALFRNGMRNKLPRLLDDFKFSSIKEVLGHAL
ncbi:DUF3473 domain-containing protein [Thermodesulfobacteriota bacterium]